MAQKMTGKKNITGSKTCVDGLENLKLDDANAWRSWVMTGFTIADECVVQRPFRRVIRSSCISGTAPSGCIIGESEVMGDVVRPLLEDAAADKYVVRKAGLGHTGPATDRSRSI